MTIIWKKRAQETPQTEQTKNPLQQDFLFDQKQLSLPNTPYTPVAEQPAQEPPKPAFIPEGQESLPHTQPIKCSDPECTSTSFNPANDPNFIIDFQDHRPYCIHHANKCYNCNESFSTKNLEKSDRDGDIYCENCMPEDAEQCPNCDHEIDEYNSRMLPTRRNTYYMKEGGCEECCEKCHRCGRVTDKENLYSEDGDAYCEDCHGELFTTCESCQDTVSQDSSHYVEGEGSFCDSCYEDKFFRCNSCEQDFEKDEQLHDFDDKEYCNDCYHKIAVEPFESYTSKLEQFSYTKKDRVINALEELAPISVKKLKEESIALSNAAKDIIQFAKGKDITQEVLDKYRDSLPQENFPVSYSAWDNLQRSVDGNTTEPTNNAQLVLNIRASNKMMDDLQKDPMLNDLFDKINTLSKQSGHPYVKNQIGWARLELDPNGKFILVDEIQTDHSNAAFKLKNDRGGEILRIRQSLVSKYGLDNDGLNALLDRLGNLIKDFPDIAIQAISQFARENNFEELYWHTYESGKKLKDNSPPKSLYDKTPKENFFKPTGDKPFNLEGDFFKRKAEDISAGVARKLMLKYAGKLIA